MGIVNDRVYEIDISAGIQMSGRAFVRDDIL